MLDQLNGMFAEKVAQKLVTIEGKDAPSNDEYEGVIWKTPATSAFMDVEVFDWGKQPYIKGGYRYHAISS